MELKSVTVAILAGGLGTRISSILPGQQKVMVKVKDHPFLEYILNQLDKVGFRKVVICTGHLGDQVELVFGDHYHNLSLSYSREASLLGTAGAIRYALPILKTDNILITNGDSFFDCDLKKFWQFHLGKGANCTVLLKEVEDITRYGTVEVDKEGQIIKFQEKTKSRRPGFINGGAYLLKRAMLLGISDNTVVSLEKDIFPKWIGEKFYGYKGIGKFIDIGTPKSYKEAQEFFSKHPL